MGFIILEVNYVENDIYPDGEVVTSVVLDFGKETNELLPKTFKSQFEASKYADISGVRGYIICNMVLANLKQ